jgi:hypothetical protein
VEAAFSTETSNPICCSTRRHGQHDSLIRSRIWTFVIAVFLVVRNKPKCSCIFLEWYLFKTNVNHNYLWRSSPYRAENTLLNYNQRRNIHTYYVTLKRFLRNHEVLHFLSVSIVEITQHAKRMRSNILSSVASLALPRSSTLSKKGHDFLKKGLLNTKCVFDFL